jgi:hypothetical protein
MAQSLKSFSASEKSLEMLLGSQTVWSTMESVWQAQGRNTVGAFLFILWSFSPIGAQASLRAPGRASDATKSVKSIRYLYTGPFATFLGNNAPDYFHISRLAGAALAASPDMLAAPQDGWDNVCVPALEKLPDSGNYWLNVPDDKSNLSTYTSVIGIPVVGLPDALPANTTASFVFDTSYMTLTCAAWEVFGENDAARLANYTGTVWRGRRDLFRHRKGESNWCFDADRNLTYFIDSDMTFSAPANVSAVADDSRPRYLNFVSAHCARGAPPSSAFTLSATKCSVVEVHVPVNVSCESTATRRDAGGSSNSFCRVASMRRLPADRAAAAQRVAQKCRAHAAHCLKLPVSRQRR